MRGSAPADLFALTRAADRGGESPVALPQRRRPGDHTEHRAARPLGTDLEVILPDMGGFGRPTSNADDPARQYGCATQALGAARLNQGLDRGSSPDTEPAGTWPPKARIVRRLINREARR